MATTNDRIFLNQEGASTTTPTANRSSVRSLLGGAVHSPLGVGALGLATRFLSPEASAAINIGAKLLTGAIGSTIFGGLPSNSAAVRTASLAANGLSFGGNFLSGSPLTANITEGINDWRVRISLPPASGDILYKDPNNSLLEPLKNTNGVIFPYLPSIQIVHNASYESVTPAHSNYAQHFYSNSSVDQILMSTNFTVQNQVEGLYVLAVIYFFRSVTKMFFGQDSLKGTPPPLVRLHGYGNLILPSVPVAINSFTMDWQPDVDYVEIPVSRFADAERTVTDDTDIIGPLGDDISDPFAKFSIKIRDTVRLPTRFLMSVAMTPIYSRKSTSQDFSLTEFAKGNLLNKAAGRGGFI